MTAPLVFITGASSGIGAAPLLMTLASRPVLGQGQCFSMSAYSSMRTSQHGPVQVCSGQDPEFWRADQNHGQWPVPYYPAPVTAADGRSVPATPFLQVFSPSPYAPEATFLDVLNMPGGPPHDLPRHLVASVLNIAIGWVPVLSIGNLQTVWLEYSGSGYYQPTAGVKWYYPDILSYLRYTMGYVSQL